MKCAVCGSQFTRSPAQIKAKHGTNYCSRSCHYRGRGLGMTGRVVRKKYVRTAGPSTAAQRARQVASRRAGKGYGHSEHTRSLLREATARNIAEGKIRTVSRLEDEVAEELGRLGVGFQRQVPIRGAKGRYVGVVDFLLADGRALEVNGTFWHTDPRVYPSGPIHDSQRRDADRWARKMTALASLGIPVVVAWELDLREDLSKAVAVALAEV